MNYSVSPVVLETATYIRFVEAPYSLTVSHPHLPYLHVFSLVLLLMSTDT